MDVFCPTDTADFFRDGIDVLNSVHIPHLLYGALACQHYTGILRDVHDFDLVVRPTDCPKALHAFAAHGYRAELTFPHWLGKIFCGQQYIDIIFSSGNGLVQIDDEWFAFSESAEVFGRPVWVCPVEEIIWSKSFVMERERFDGADIAHLIRARATLLDWPRLCQRFGPHWRLLLAHLLLFGYIYPSERANVPPQLMRELYDRFWHEAESPTPTDRMCQGTLLSREQYLVDMRQWGYADARLRPRGSMTAANVAHWTASIGNDAPTTPHDAPRFDTMNANS